MSDGPLRPWAPAPPAGLTPGWSRPPRISTWQVAAGVLGPCLVGIVAWRALSSTGEAAVLADPGTRRLEGLGATVGVPRGWCEGPQPFALETVGHVGEGRLLYLDELDHPRGLLLVAGGKARSRPAFGCAEAREAVAQTLAASSAPGQSDAEHCTQLPGGRFRLSGEVRDGARVWRLDAWARRAPLDDGSQIRVAVATAWAGDAARRRTTALLGGVVFDEVEPPRARPQPSRLRRGRWRRPRRHR